MTLFFTSDTHFNHANIINLGKGRPFRDIDHHNEMLIKNWNDRVMPNDTVIHLGDVALGPWPVGINMVGRLAGRKVLVPGNHDRVSSLEKEARRERFMPDYRAVFDDVLDEVIQMDLGPFEVLASHYPYSGESDASREDRYDWLRPENEGTILIHGHTHTDEVVSRHEGSLQIHVGVDSWGYAPVSEDEIVDTIEEALRNG